MKAKVYFSTMRARPNMNLLQKLERLITAAGIERIDFNDKFAAIKIHFGEPGNLAYLRPNYAKVVASNHYSFDLLTGGDIDRAPHAPTP